MDRKGNTIKCVQELAFRGHGRELVGILGCGRAQSQDQMDRWCEVSGIAELAEPPLAHDDLTPTDIGALLSRKWDVHSVTEKSSRHGRLDFAHIQSSEAKFPLLCFFVKCMQSE